MSEKEINRIIENTTFSMQAEGFNVSEQQQDELRSILEGRQTFEAVKKKYIDQARKWAENKEKVI